MTITKAVVLRIKNLLSEKKMTKRQLAKKAHLSEGTIASLCREISNGVNLSTVLALARGFDMTMSEFLDDDLFNQVEVDN